MANPILGRQGRGREHPSREAFPTNYATQIQTDLSPTQQYSMSPNFVHNMPMQLIPQQQQPIPYNQIITDFQLPRQEIQQIPQVQVIQEVQMMQEVLQPVFLHPQPIQIQEIQEVVFVQQPPRALSPKPMRPLRPPPLRERAAPSPPALPPPPPEIERYRERAAPPPPPPEPEIKYVDR